MAYLWQYHPPPAPFPHRDWEAALEPGAWISLHFHSSPFSQLNKALDTNEYNWWRVLIFLPLERQTRSDWSLALNILLAIRHFHTHNFARITSKEPVCFEGWNCKFSVPIWSPWEPNLTHRRQLSLTEGESDFLPLPVFFVRVSSAIADIIRVLAIKASCFHTSRENLGEASQACYESTLISGTSFFSQWYFPSSKRSTNTQILWEIVASSPFLGQQVRVASGHNVVIYHILWSRNITLF